MCARAELSLLVAWSARGQSVCVSVKEFTGLRSPHAHVIPHGALLFDWVCAKCIAGFREKGWERFATLGEYVASSGLLVLASPCFSKTLVYFQRAHPPFVLYFTATFISFSCCLIRARSPV